MTIQQAKQIDLVDYLSTLGYRPHHVHGNNYWFSSPLSAQAERTPSFKVNRKCNCWYDWSQGNNIGGNLVDFGIRYHHCSVTELLHKLDAHLVVIPPPRLYSKEPEGKIVITSSQKVQSVALLQYLEQRQIPPVVYHEHCREVSYSLKNKRYYAIGFKNDAGGYELRNAYTKLSSTPKGSTFINNGSSEISAFEGFFNFLSFCAMQQTMSLPKTNYLILNSASFFDKNMPLMQSHNRVLLYLDNDATGQNCSQRALSINIEKFVDQRTLYKEHKDLNDWLIHQKLSNHHRHKQTLK